jgi:hypothetical protein
MIKGNISFMTETGLHKLLVGGSNPADVNYLFVWYIIFPDKALEV